MAVNASASKLVIITIIVAFCLIAYWVSDSNLTTGNIKVSLSSKGKTEVEHGQTPIKIWPRVTKKILDIKKYFFPAIAESTCDDVMHNLPNGRWVHWKNFVKNTNSIEYELLETDERKFDDYMTEFRIKRGIHTKLWRDDLKCGLKNKQTKPPGNAWGGSVGAWCDAKSTNPCCSSETDGTCGMRCNCQECIDMRKIIHAEFAKWVPFDENCKWKNYTTDEACKVMGRFAEIHFVGDSFLRKMARVMILLLRNDLNHGFILKSYNEAMKRKCVSDDQLFWTECRAQAKGTMKEILLDESPVCGMDLLRFGLHGNYAFDAGGKALALTQKMIGKPGSVILLAVGGHMGCVTEKTFNIVLKPSLQYINSFYKNSSASPLKLRWPLIIFMFPDTPDVLKSPDYREANGKVPCYRFTDQMIKYLEETGTSYLDFRKVTSDVHSYDGTHHGIGVNVQKVQILLNYLDTLHW